MTRKEIERARRFRRAFHRNPDQTMEPVRRGPFCGCGHTWAWHAGAEPHRCVTKGCDCAAYADSHHTPSAENGGGR